MSAPPKKLLISKSAVKDLCKPLEEFPTVSVITPTYQREPFWHMAIKCFQNQTYPKDKIEWIILDDSKPEHRIGDLVAHIPQVRYYTYDTKMTLGAKRNLGNSLATGKIIVYVDDDDFYSEHRISHAVSTLRKNKKALCAGSSRMYMYFKHINKMYLFGPYHEMHATAATFAFRRELLQLTSFSEDAAVAEEKFFLKDYTVPFVQLDPLKTIVVFSHTQNSFDKREMLRGAIMDPKTGLRARNPDGTLIGDPNIHDTDLTPADLVKDPEILKFFMEDIDGLLAEYEAGLSIHKPDVLEQLDGLRKKRTDMEKANAEQQKTAEEYAALLNTIATKSTAAKVSKSIGQIGATTVNTTITHKKLSKKQRDKEKKKRENEATEQIEDEFVIIGGDT